MKVNLSNRCGGISGISLPMKKFLGFKEKKKKKKKRRKKEE